MISVSVAGQSNTAFYPGTMSWTNVTPVFTIGAGTYTLTFTITNNQNQ
jgi:hypothetical protein